MLALSSSSNLRLSATGRCPLCDFEDYLAGFAGLDCRDRCIYLRHWEPVRDDRRRIELTRAEKSSHLMPCLVHPAPHHSINGEALEDDLLWKIDFDRLDWNSEHLDSAPDSDHGKCLMDRGGHPGHLEHHVDAEPIGRRLHHALDLMRHYRVVRAHSLCEIQSLLIDVGGDDARGAGRSTDANGKNTDGSASCDEDLCAGNVRRECRVKCVSHRIVNAADVIADRLVEMPHVGS